VSDAGKPRLPRLPRSGRDADDVIRDLAAKRARDARWQDGRTFGMVFDGGAEVRAVAETATSIYLHENALNTDAFPSLAEIQREVVGACADLFHGDGAAGFMTSGGTESILMAVKAARERARRERGVHTPSIVVPESAHAAFHKAGRYFGVEVRTVPVGADWRADAAAMERAITDDTALVVGSAPQYPQGVVDPIPELAALAADRGANCHVDACMGGFVLPFLESLGEAVAPWDFRVPGVTSISADVHKLGYAPKGASVIVYRTPELRRDQTFVFDGWLGGMYASPGMQGSRPGAPMAAAWAVLQLLGQEGYERLTRIAVDTARRLMAAIRAQPGLDVLGDPTAHVFAFRAEEGSGIDVFAVGDALRDRGWHLDRQQPPPSLHLTVSAGNAPVVDDFVRDLAAAVGTAAGRRGAAGTYSTAE
jgi:sphinganine-1-phosphate aldolase